MLGIDHVAYAVGDLDDAAVRFRDEFGLDSIEGGRHERWGTANRIVPLGDQYLELVAAVDPSTAAGSGFGRGVLEHAEGGGGWFTIAVVTDDLDAVASRLGWRSLPGRGGGRTARPSAGGWPGSTTRGASPGCRSS